MRFFSDSIQISDSLPRLEINCVVDGRIITVQVRIVARLSEVLTFL